MTLAEMSGQIGNVLLFGIGIIILLLIHLIYRVSALDKKIDALNKTANAAEADIFANAAAIGTIGTPSLEAGSKAIPDTVVAAISAAVNQYRTENI